MAALRAGSFVTTIVNGSARATLDGDDIRQGVTAALDDSLQVVDSKIQVPGIVAGVLNGEWLHYNYFASVTVKTSTDTDSDTVGRLIAAAFEQTTGISVTSYSSSAVAAPPESATSLPATWWQSLSSGAASVANGLQLDTQLVIAGLVLVLLVLIVVVGPSAVKALA